MASYVRTATDADLRELARIEEEAETGFAEGGRPAPRAAASSGAERAAEAGYLFVVAEEPHGPAVGFVRVREQEGNTHLSQLCVRPGHTRRGHGRELVQAALAEASRRGHDTMTVRTFPDIPWNAPLYAALGFRETDSPEHPLPGELIDTEHRLGLDPLQPRILMTKQLGGDLDMDPQAFEALVTDELDRLPDEMVRGLENLAFVVEDRPEDGSLDLLGLYDGLAVTERGNYGMGELPDRIVIYREPHLAQSASEEQLRAEVHTTLVHEIAHYYGIDDEQLHELGWA